MSTKFEELDDRGRTFIYAKIQDGLAEVGDSVRNMCNELGITQGTLQHLKRKIPIQLVNYHRMLDYIQEKKKEQQIIE